MGENFGRIDLVRTITFAQAKDIVAVEMSLRVASLHILIAIFTRHPTTFSSLEQLYNKS